MADTRKTRRPGVPCPSCGHGISEVIRVVARGAVLQRVRDCKACRLRFTTHETTTQTATGIARDTARLATDITSLISSLENSPLARLARRQ